MRERLGWSAGCFSWSGIVVACALAVLPVGVLAQSAGRTPSSAGAAVYFIDIKDGATLPEKFTVRFGLRNMGLAPAGMPKAGTGHHHVLVDAEVPAADRPIPNDPKHLHFGAGQTEAELTLSPGPHTLQLIFADHDHVPHDPPLMSERVRVLVQGAGPAAASPSAGGSPRKRSPASAAVYFVYPKDGAVIYPMSTIRFGLTGMGVAPAGIDKANTGHHHLLVDTPTPDLGVPIPNNPRNLHFGAGQTEVKLTLEPGEHTLQLVFGDENHVPHDPPVMSEQIKVLVRPGGPGRGR